MSQLAGIPDNDFKHAVDRIVVSGKTIELAGALIGAASDITVNTAGATRFDGNVSGKSITTLEGLPALWAAQRGTTKAQKCSAQDQ